MKPHTAKNISAAINQSANETERERQKPNNLFDQPASINAYWLKKDSSSIRRILTSTILFGLSGLLAVVVLFSSPASVVAQSTFAYTNDKVDQTLRSNARINPSTLAMELSIPIANLPGRGGASMPLVFNYSSKVWELRNEGSATVNQADVRPIYSNEAMAGWTSSYDIPTIDTVVERYDCRGNAMGENGVLPQGCGEYRYVKRIKVKLPGGSTHELRKDDFIHDVTNGGLMDKTGVFYAVDGTRVRLEWGTQGESTLFMPDGGRYFFADGGNNPPPCYKYVDRNGNVLTYNSSTGAWTDTMGRTLASPIPFTYTQRQEREEGTQSFTVPGLGSTTQTYQLVWKNLSSSGVLMNGQALRYVTILCDVATRDPVLFESNSTIRPCDGTAGYFDPVVLSEIILPNNQKYQFKYTYFGEIGRIDYPTGAWETFVYAEIKGLGWDYQLDSAKANSYGKANRGVIDRYVGGDGVAGEQHWIYSAGYETTDTYGANTYVMKTTAPDNTVTKRFQHRVKRPVNDGYGNYGFDTILAGREMETQTLDSNDAIRSRTLFDWETTKGADVGSGVYPERDARLKRQINLIFEPDSTSALATMSETAYDTAGNSDPAYFSSLNAKQTKTYHYVALPVTNAQNSTIDQIAALFTSANLATIAETDYLYDANYKARNIIGLANEMRVLNPTSSNTVLSKSQIIYDQTASYPIINAGTTPSWENPNSNYRANATTTRTWVQETNSWIETHAQFDNFGNLRKQWDSSGDANRFIETQYSSQYNYAYPTKIVAQAPDPTGTHGTTATSEVTKTYDFTTGLALTVMDANGQTTTNEYNVMLRPQKIIPPTGGAVTEAEYGVPDINGQYSASQRFVKVKTQIDETNWAESTTWFDGLGRIVKTQSKDAQGDVFAEVEYDDVGRIKQVSSPYRQGEQKLWSKSRYDDVGRVVEGYAPALGGQTGASLGTVEFGISTVSGYVGTFVVGMDASGRRARSIMNAFGQLIRVDEPTGGNDLGTLASPNQPTFYKYSVRGELIKMTQGNSGQAGQTIQNRYFMYDSLSRLIRVRQPEQNVNANLVTTLNPENNQWTAGFTYDVFGNVITATDAKGIVITNNYDNAGRVKTRSYSDGTPQANYYYDGKGLAQSPQFARGNLTKVSSSVSENRYTSFDNFGRMLASQQITDGQTYNFGYKYNLSGGLIEETYPSGRVVKNHLGSDGGLTAVSSKVETGQFKNYASNFDYSATGALKSMMLGNGRWETAQFNSRLQLTQIGLGTSIADTSLWKANYEYGELNTDGTTVNATKNTGSVAKQTVTLPTTSFVQTYKYDELNRLTEAKETTNGGQNWQQSFGYDQFGNRTSFSQTIGGVTTTQTPTVDANTNRFTTGQGYVYDFNGNLIQDAEGRNFTFNGDDRQVQVKDANQAVIGTYFYDGGGARVKKVTNTETTVFVYDGGGALAAEYSTDAPPAIPTTSYLTTDNLGSPRVITDKQGNIISRRDFMPFGEELGAGIGGRTESLKYSIIGTDTIRKRFTGYEKDDETQLDFAEARMYQNRHGRFTAVDPLLSSADLTNPQTFNRYIYTGNNPVNYTDPSGLDYYKDKKGDVYYFEGSGKHEGYTNITGQDIYIGGGGCLEKGGCIDGGQLVHFNSNSFDVITNPTSAQAAQIAQATGTEVRNTVQEVIETSGVILSSAIATWGENNGFTPLPVQHSPEGRLAGNILSIITASAEIYIGTGLIGLGGGEALLTSPACSTGVGCAIPGAGVVVAVGGVVVAGHGVFTIGNTLYNAIIKGQPTDGGQYSPEDVQRMEKGRAPTGEDGHPVELHHEGQKPDGPLKEMTRTDHRGKGNYSKNHPNGNKSPSKIDRKKFKKQREEYWKNKAKEIKK